MKARTAAAVALLSIAAMARGGSVEEDWQGVVALDAGPQFKPRTAAEAQAAILKHHLAQEDALRGFLKAHPKSEHDFEAKLRLARLLALRGQMIEGHRARAEATSILDALEKSATPEQRAEIDFARIAQAMRRLDPLTPAEREALLARARAFQTAHPEDRRLAQMLTELATQFDSQPKTKQRLLLDALPLSRDEDLTARIHDDLRRLDLLGQPVALAGPAPDGREINIEGFRGRVLLVCFFAVWSQPSLEAVEAVQKAVATFPKDRVQALGVSLDVKPEKLADFVNARSLEWPLICDGKGWESPAIRALGINALPTVWLVDRDGKLRSLNAREGTVEQVRAALGK